MSHNSEAFLVHLILAVLLAPLLPGIINRVKAKFAGRHGKPLLQLYYDLARLLRKGEVKSHTASWVFSAGPSIGLATTLLALMLLPLGAVPSPMSFTGDFILVAYLLGTGRFAIVLAALDTGSSFEGMGASREATYSALAEPLLFLVFLVLVSLGLDFVTGSNLASSGEVPFSLSTMFCGQAAELWLTGHAELLLIPLLLFILLLLENCRIPIDDPNTHLELTMIHEVMVLDHSGPSLAMIEYAAALKLWLFSALMAGLMVPPLPLPAQTALTLAAILALTVVVGIVESVMARLRLIRIPQLLGGAAALAGLVLVLTQVR